MEETKTVGEDTVVEMVDMVVELEQTEDLYELLLAWWFVGGSSLVRENAFSLNSIK